MSTALEDAINATGDAISAVHTSHRIMVSLRMTIAEESTEHLCEECSKVTRGSKYFSIYCEVCKETKSVRISDFYIISNALNLKV